MQILEAYCEELGEVIDIYAAQRAYFAQPAGRRRRFTFRCSDPACRAAHNPLVSGVGYDKLAEEGEKFRQIHFRAPPDHPHLDSCIWVRDDARRDAGGEPAGTRRERAKATNVIDVFAPCHADKPATATAAGSGSDVLAVAPDDDDGAPGRARNGQSRTGLLERFIDCWAQFEGEALKEQYVTIEGERLSYRQAVTQVRFIAPGTNGRRIVYGGARISLWPADKPKRVYLNFLDECEQFEEHQGSRKLALDLPLARIEDYPGGGLLLSRLEEGRLGKNYVRVFAWGRIVENGAKPGWRLEIESLDNLVVKVIARAGT
ncbi:hypothetical protein [Pseudoduganella armeniaca]|uniref:Uncharacterized protein n=1 Tax=Pseudoduganella armeniaca TaxID=2072590 RepID=A0A2R4CC60_9BURK|nr:hypothetical protein [Pseudoduganella armeniaca]AVR97080.1 hypothetical protein C9I28_16580 [Pseudoduganella armeniaca]